MKKNLGRGRLEDATYQIATLYAFQFQRRRILKSSFLVPIFKLVIPWDEQILSQGVSYEQTW